MSILRSRVPPPRCLHGLRKIAVVAAAHQQVFGGRYVAGCHGTTRLNHDRVVKGLGPVCSQCGVAGRYEAAPG
jgi:hypothetical protein